MSDIFVSYIIPCYNTRDYLPACIEGLRKQRILGGRAAVEFVMVNDGSTDDTLAIIKGFAEQDSRVVVVDQQNQGVSTARNHGLSVAKGKYVFFLDSDDCLTDDASDLIYKFCEGVELDVVLFGNYKQREGNTERIVWVDPAKLVSPGFYLKGDYVEKASYFPMSFKLYRREFLLSNGISFDSHLVAGEVYTFFIHVLSLCSKVGVSSSFVMSYLKRKGDSATTVINVERDLSILETLHTVNGYVRDYYPRLMEKRAFLTSSFWLVTSFAVIKYVGRTPYNKEIGRLISMVKSDEQYRDLLVYFTSRGAHATKHTLLAFFLRFFPPCIAYFIIRSYYRFATRRNTE